MAEDNIQNEPIQIDLDIVDTQEVPEVQEEKKLKETLQKIKETATEEDPSPRSSSPCAPFWVATC